MSEPIARRVTRWVCPFCSRGRSRRSVISEHIPNCYHNPAARACLTCMFHVKPSGDGVLEPYSPEFCLRGVEMPERGLNTHCPQYKDELEP